MDELLEPSRYLDLEGALNVRDLGGFTTREGQRTHWRVFLRSGRMDELTTVSQDALLDYGLRTVIDLRTSIELQTNPNVFEGSAKIRYCHLNMMGDGPLDFSRVTQAGGERSDRTQATYSSILDQRQGSIGETLAVLADEESRPAVYHCAGGKDRTGIITALLLGLAGVSDETIAADYALSARYLIDEYLSQVTPDPDSLDISTWQDYERFYCPSEGMRKVLAHLDENYGGVEGYVRTAGLDDRQIASLRNALVE